MDKRVRAVSDATCKPSVPQIRPGYSVEVHQKIKEGKKERIQIFKGTVIAVKNTKSGVDSTFTVRRIASGVGVEKVFAIHSPNVIKVDIKRAHKVRRAKLGYLRFLSGKALRMKEVPLKRRDITVDVKAPVTETPSATPAEVATETAAE